MHNCYVDKLLRAGFRAGTGVWLVRLTGVLRISDLVVLPYNPRLQESLKIGFHDQNVK